MKHVVEYKLHGGEVPYFIEDGGYFLNNGKMIGLTKDDVNCYVPASTTLVTFDTQDAFVTHVLTINMVSLQGEALTDQQKTTLANSWWNARQ